MKEACIHFVSELKYKNIRTKRAEGSKQGSNKTIRSGSTDRVYLELSGDRVQVLLVPILFS